MKNKAVIIFLITLAVIIVIVMVSEYLSDRPDRGKPNPFQYDVEEFKSVDPSLITYRESVNFRTGFEEPAAIAIFNDTIYAAGDDIIKVIDLKGTLISQINLPVKPRTLEIFNKKLVFAAGNRIFTYSLSDGGIIEWTPLEESSFVTAIAASGDNDIFIADAANRRVMRFSTSGSLISVFDGKAEEGALHGFIIPSPYFDMDINDEGELWIVNPGMHSLENYTFEGQLRSHWKRSGMRTESFSGCCNPAFFTFLGDGRFVTSEKGLVRIKTYKVSGEFEGVVATPGKFIEDGHAPDVAADSRNNIYAMDFDKKMIRVFTPVE
jgi:hypothetical protein